jgi:hypothetical protein
MERPHCPRRVDCGSSNGRLAGILVFLIATCSSLGGCGGGADSAAWGSSATVSSSGGTPGSGTLTWNQPVPATNLAGYRVYYGTVPGSYLQPPTQGLDVGGTGTTYKLTGLTSQVTYYIAVTAYDTSGTESAYSNEVTWTAP